jgi:hypothetical protein
VIVRFIIDKIEIDVNNITAKGYYYYIDENGSIVMLSQLGASSQKQWEMVAQIETTFLGEFESANSLKSVILQRLKEFTNLQLTQENGENYGTIASDWEEDI